jgi:serine/threonine-protein phosphatase PGAM5
VGDRVLHLVRHGQYVSEPQQRLTDLGRAQAALVAARLAGRPIAAIHTSTAPRALETAQTIARQFPALPLQRRHLLVECIPTGPRRPLPEALASRPLARWSRDLKQLQSLCDRYLKPARGAEREEVLVFHGNLIRAMVCSALRLPLGAWCDMWVDHASVTTLRVGRKRSVLVGLNDVGHLPPALVTAM